MTDTPSEITLQAPTDAHAALLSLTKIVLKAIAGEDFSADDLRIALENSRAALAGTKTPAEC